MSLSWFAWLRLQLWMFVMRLGVRFIFMRSLKSKRSILPASYSVEPNRVIRVPSTKDPRRTILVHVFYPPGYDPASTLKPLPVHLNVHGSGFMWNTFTAYAMTVCISTQRLTPVQRLRVRSLHRPESRLHRTRHRLREGTRTSLPRRLQRRM